MKPAYRAQVVWNREFFFCNVGSRFEDLDKAITFVQSIENAGDGASVKKSRIIDEEEDVVWAYGKKL